MRDKWKAGTDRMDAQHNGIWALRPAMSVALLLAAIGCAALSRGIPYRMERPLTGDEGISLLAATCHQKEFLDTLRERRPPYGEWVSGRLWKRFVLPEGRGCFATIASDLAATDSHPPLYFWLLHAWIWVAGTERPALLLLNLVIAGATAVALFRVGARLFSSDLAGGTLAVFYCASAQAAAAGLEARPYELLACCVAWLAERIVACTAVETTIRWRDRVGLAVCALAGLLTHYLFLLAVLPAAVLGLARLDRAALRRAGGAAVAVAVGLAVACVVHPVLGQIAGRTPSQTRTIAFHLRRVRLPDITRFFTLPFDAIRESPVLGYSGLLVVGVAAVAWVVHGGHRRDALARRMPVARVLFAALAAFAMALYWYAGGHLPPHSVGPKYLTFAWPLLALAPVAIACALDVVRPWALMALLWISGLTVWDSIPNRQASAEPGGDKKEAAEALAYFTTSWHPTAAMLTRLQDDAPVFISKPGDASQAYYAAWLRRVDRGDAVSVAIPKKSARELTERLKADGYRIDLPPGTKSQRVRFRVQPRGN
jgi:hypothetical protein